MQPPSTPKGILQEIVSKQREQIEICYDEYLRREPQFSNGSIAIRWSINATGQVQQPEVLDTNLSDEDLKECVLHEVAKMNFDPKKFSENTEFSYRFHFKARAPASIAFE